jgi:nitrogen fixation NifU-like protein
MTADSGNREDLVRLYREVIKAHAADPVGYRRIIDATHRHEAYNPLCGDRVEIAMRVRRDCIEAAAFDGEACAICMASASLLCSLAPGRSTSDLRELSEGLNHALGGGTDLNRKDSRMNSVLRDDPSRDMPPKIPEDLHPLLGVRPYPSRIRCATLPWDAAVNALAD